ncbi:MAG: hypothetical protein QHJ81_15550 [Anaerolineae bacterium]|nr:hypothetical protein [Anaerolineae bacterium]
MRTYHKPGLVPAIVLAITLFSASIVVAKTELITNGTFDTNTNGWYNLPSTVGSITYEGTEGHTATGAAYVQNLSTSTSTTSNGGAQCVSLPLPISSYYMIEGWVKVPTQSNSTATGYIKLGFYSTTNCSGSQLADTFDTNTVSVGSDWTFVRKIVNTSSVSTAQSVEVRLYVRKSGSGSAYAYFDDISFFPSNANAVTISAFTANAEPAAGPAAWPSIALAGVAATGLGALLWIRRQPRAS